MAPLTSENTGESVAAEPTPTQVLDLPLDPNKGPGAASVRGYLTALLTALWHHGEDFGSKRPFGNSGWQYDVYVPLMKAGYIGGKLDEDGDVEACDYRAGDRLIASAIVALGAPAVAEPVAEVLAAKDAEIATAQERRLAAAPHSDRPGVWMSEDGKSMALETDDGSFDELVHDPDAGWLSKGMLDMVPDEWDRLVALSGEVIGLRAALSRAVVLPDDLRERVFNHYPSEGYGLDGLLEEIRSWAPVSTSAADDVEPQQKPGKQLGHVVIIPVDNHFEGLCLGCKWTAEGGGRQILTAMYGDHACADFGAPAVPASPAATPSEDPAPVWDAAILCDGEEFAALPDCVPCGGCGKDTTGTRFAEDGEGEADRDAVGQIVSEFGCTPSAWATEQAVEKLFEFYRIYDRAAPAVDTTVSAATPSECSFTAFGGYVCHRPPTHGDVCSRHTPEALADGRTSSPVVTPGEGA